MVRSGENNGGYLHKGIGCRLLVTVVPAAIIQHVSADVAIGCRVLSPPTSEK